MTHNLNIFTAPNQGKTVLNWFSTTKTAGSNDAYELYKYKKTEVWQEEIELIYYKNFSIMGYCRKGKKKGKTISIFKKLNYGS